MAMLSRREMAGGGHTLQITIQDGATAAAAVAARTPNVCLLLTTPLTQESGGGGGDSVRTSGLIRAGNQRWLYIRQGPQWGL